MFRLLVTWFTYNAAPQSYQAEFASAATCEAARAQLLSEAGRLKADSDANVARLAQQGIAYNPHPTPTVTAVCARR